MKASGPPAARSQAWRSARRWADRWARSLGLRVGGAAGGLAGHGIAAAIDPAVEDAYWRDNYRSRPYVRAERRLHDYQDAYRYGWESRANVAALGRHRGGISSDGWDKAKAKSRLGWIEAKDAVRDGWHRVERRCPGDADGDGR